MRHHPVKFPSRAAEARAALVNYEQRSSNLDSVLYRLCAEHPRHEEYKWVHAKVFIIGRTYSSGMERNVAKLGGQGSSLRQVAQQLWKQHEEVDRLFRHLQAVSEPLSAEKVAKLVELHGHLLKVIRPVTRSGRSPRSFVSKYMHFHNSAVPIYDSYAASELKRWSQKKELFDEPQDADHRYAGFTTRFYGLLCQLRRVDSRMNVRLTDAFLISSSRRSASS